MKSTCLLLATALLMGSSHALVVSSPSSQSPSSLAYASDATLQIPAPSIESRIRQKAQSRPTAPKIKKAPSRPAYIEEVKTMAEYNSVVAGEKDQMVVVRFHATWCRSCKAMAPSYYKFAGSFEGNNVKFVDIAINAANTELHAGLGVTSIPFAHVYHPEAGLVEERKLSRKNGQYSNFEKVVKSYVEESCNLINDDDYSNPWGLVQEVSTEYA